MDIDRLDWVCLWGLSLIRTLHQQLTIGQNQVLVLLFGEQNPLGGVLPIGPQPRAALILFGLCLIGTHLALGNPPFVPDKADAAMVADVPVTAIVTVGRILWVVRRIRVPQVSGPVNWSRDIHDISP